MEDSRFMKTLLLDFYGELLTEKQRECCELRYNDDLSLSEIAEQSGVSRQGVWDNIRRAEASLAEYEEKTGLIKRFDEVFRVIRSAKDGLETLSGETEGETRRRIEEIAAQLGSLNMKG